MTSKTHGHHEAVCCQEEAVNNAVQEIDYSRKPLVDVIEKDDAYELYLDMPGVESENLEVVYDQGELSVRGLVVAGPENSELLYNERPTASFCRSFSIADGIDPDKITARLDNGVVMIELGKTAALLPKRIEVRSG
jgi:HSP20 family protein